MRISVSSPPECLGNKFSGGGPDPGPFLLREHTHPERSTLQQPAWPRSLSLLLLKIYVCILAVLGLPGRAFL